MIKISKLIMIIWLWMTVPFHLACQSDPRTAKLKEISKKSDTLIEFFGKVEDNYGNPIEGVSVEIVINRFSQFGPFFRSDFKINKITDKYGFFTIHNHFGEKLYISKINKKNYDNKSSYSSPRVFYYFTNNGLIKFEYQEENSKRTVSYVPGRQKPIIYRLRKKGPDVFLMKKGWTGFRFTPAESGTSKGQDFSRNAPEFPMQAGANFHPTVYGQPVTCDLRAKATLDARSGEWTIELSPGHPDGGILASNELLYEAPATGYQPTLVFKAQGRGPKDGNDRGDVKTPLPAKYLYVRSRGYQTVYSRVELDEAIRVEWGPSPKDRTTIELTCTLSAGPTYMNPYGERNLEEATELPWPVLRDIRNQAEEALHRGQRPTAPDLQERVAAWERSRPLTDKVKDWFK